MQKINFQRGSVVTPDYLNKIQESIKFTASPREDYFAEPDSTEQQNWEIGTRDGIKGWEIDPDGALGAISHAGRILGVEGTQIVYGPSSSTRYSALYDEESNFTGLDTNTLLGTGIYGILVEAGSVISATGESQSWLRSYFEVSGGATIYVIYHSGVAELQTVGALPNRGEPFAPLAKVEVGLDGSLLVDDLRSVSRVDSLYNYTRSFSNTELISESYTPSAWQRVLVDATNGTIIITLPFDANDGDQIVLVDALNQVSATNKIIIRPAPTVLLQNSSSDWVVGEPGAIIELYFIAELNSWRFKSGISNLCDLTPGQFMQCGGSIDAGVTLSENCPDGEDLPIDDRYGVSPGVYSYDPSTMKCTKVIGETTAVYSSGVSDPEFNFELFSSRCGADRFTADDSGVDTYGSSDYIPRITVNAEGKISNIEEVPVTPIQLPIIDDLNSGTYGNRDSVAQIKVTNKGLVEDVVNVPIFNDVQAGTYGNSLKSARVTVDSKGRISDLEEVDIFYSTASGTFGSLTATPQITVDSRGRIVSITEQPLELPPPATTTDLQIYVNGVSGSDQNTGANNSPVKSLQKAILIASQAIYTANTKAIVYLADATYTMRTLIPKRFSGRIDIIGNEISPANVILNGSAANSYFPSEEAAGNSAHTFICESECRIRGVTFEGSVIDNRTACTAQNEGNLYIENCIVDGGEAGIVSRGGSMVQVRDINIKGSYNTAVFLNQSAGLELTSNTVLPASIEMLDSVTFNEFIHCTENGYSVISNVKFENVTAAQLQAKNFYTSEIDSTIVLDTIKDSANTTLTSFTGSATEFGKVLLYY